MASLGLSVHTCSIKFYMHLVGVEDSVVSPVMFPKETGVSGSWPREEGRSKGTGK